MKNNIIILLFLLASSISFAQVQSGINTKTPTTTLEVVANSADNSVLDGITIPKLTCAEIINKQLNAPTPYAAPQAGTIVYITDTSGLCVGPPVTEVQTKGVGFYVFDGTEFIKIALDSSIDNSNWSLAGNMTTDPTTDFIGTVDAQDLAIRTNNTDAVRVAVNGNVGIRTTTPAADLEVVGDANNGLKTDGVTIPKITGNQLRAKNINSAYGASQTGTLMYVSAPATAPATADLTENVVAAGLYYFDGTTWQVTAKHSVGDIKQGFQLADHDGWVLLDGRDLSMLSATQQAAFTFMFPAATNIQNTTNANGASQNSATYLANIDGDPDTVGTIAGNLNNLWDNTDLPEHTHTGTTSENGNHSHRPSSGFLFLRSGPAGGPGMLRGGGDFGRVGQVSETNTVGNHEHTITTNTGDGITLSSAPTTNRTLDVNTFIYLGN